MILESGKDSDLFATLCLAYSFMMDYSVTGTAFFTPVTKEAELFVRVSLLGR